MAQVAFLFLLPGAMTPAASAATLIWTNSGGSSWTSGVNWSTGGVPGTTDDAQFGIDPTGKSAVGISMNSTLLNNGPANEAVGAVEQTSARTSNLIITNSSSSENGVFTLNGAAVNGIDNVILRNASSANLTLANGSSKTMGVVLANPTENIVLLDGSGNLTISSLISSVGGATPFTFAGSGSGATAITGTNNTFTGDIDVTGAEVDFSGDGSLGNTANNIIINGGRFGIAGGTSVIINPARAIFLGTNSIGINTGAAISAPKATGLLTFDGVLANLAGSTGTLVKQGAGTLSLGGASTFSGNVSVNNGTVQLTTGNNRLPTGATVYLGQSDSANLGTLDLSGISQQIAGLGSTPGINTNSLAKNCVTNSNPSTSATLTLAGSGTYAYGDGSSENSGIVAGPVNLILTGSGSQILADTNSSFSGALTVRQGTLSVPLINNDSQNGPLGNSTNVVTLGSGGQIATLEYTGNTAVSTKNFALATGGTGVFQIDGIGQTLTINGIITGDNGSLQKHGPGTLNLNNAETYSGPTMVSSGSLALGSAGSIADSQNIVVSGGAIFDVSALNGFVLGAGQTLSNSSSTAVLNGNINTASGTVSLSYVPGAPAFMVTNGTFSLAAGTTFEVKNAGAALTLGDYKLISTNFNGSVIIGGSTPPTVDVAGNGITAGTTAGLQVISGELYLVVATPVNITPPILKTGVNDGNLNLSWPSDHTGWRLLVQTNHLALGISPNPNDWMTVTGSSATNTVVEPITETNSAEFYRLIYP